MLCKICQIANSNAISDIEIALLVGKGTLSNDARRKIAAKHVAYKEQIMKIDHTACQLHYNFHQKITRIPSIAPVERNTLAKDVGKDEAEILYELLTSQAATFNALSNQINDALTERSSELTTMLVHPTITQFYREMGDSIRLTVREIKELNASVNGDNDPAAKGIAALIGALHGDKKQEKGDDMATKDFD